MREELERFQDQSKCETCNGYRLKPEALAVKIGGKHVGEVCNLSIKAADLWFKTIDTKMNAKQKEIASRVL